MEFSKKLVIKMMHKFKREVEKTEIQIFNEKFRGKVNRFTVIADPLGKIISIESENKEIIAYAKKLGLKNE